MNQPSMELFIPRGNFTRYANTPFEVDEYDDSDSEFDSSSSYAHSDESHLTYDSRDTFLSNQSYLILDFEDGELSPCDTERGYGIMHPKEQEQTRHSFSTSSFADGPRDVYDSAESIWYDDEDEDAEYESDSFDSFSLADSGSFSLGQPSLTMSSSNITSSEEDTDELATPISTEDEDESDRESSYEPDQAALAELRSTLKRHLPPSANGSAYFEMLVADALSSLDQALKEAPENCFEEMCWDAQGRTRASGDGREELMDGVDSRRKSAQTVKFIDVPEEVTVPAPLEWDCREQHDDGLLAYNYFVPSPSQDIGFSPRSNPKQHSSSGSFKRLARHFRFPAREVGVY